MYVSYQTKNLKRSAARDLLGAYRSFYSYYWAQMEGESEADSPYRHIRRRFERKMNTIVERIEHGNLAVRCVATLQSLKLADQMRRFKIS